MKKHFEKLMAHIEYNVGNTVGMPVVTKYSLKFSKTSLAKISAAALVFLLTLLIMPFYTDGDQWHYRGVYEALPELSLTEGFLFYSVNLASQELTHFLLSWIASRFIDKDLFIAFSNAILAYLSMSLLMKWKASTIIALLLVLTNFYFLVLYFAAERLKFGFIFLALSLIHIDKIKRFGGFAWLAMISHVQVAIVYTSMLFNFLIRKMLKMFRTGKVHKLVFFVPLLFVPLVLLSDHIFTKFIFYYDEAYLAELARILIFFLIAFWYAKVKSEVFLIFVPLIIAVFLVGGDRVNLFGYFAVLYYGFQHKGGWNLGVLSTSAYFSYSSINFLANIFQYGHGFPN